MKLRKMPGEMSLPRPASFSWRTASISTQTMHVLRAMRADEETYQTGSFLIYLLSQDN